MKFLIIGDSWGLGEYTINNDVMMVPVPDTSMSYYLTELGHSVVNLSVGSASNFGKLREARTYLDDQSSDFDYIIWLHTEPVRDVWETVLNDPIDAPKQYPDFDKIKDFTQAMKYITRQNYIFAQTIFDNHAIPFIVIGGLGRLEPFINEYTFAQHKVYSWVQDILGTDFEFPANRLYIWYIDQLFEQVKFEPQSVIDNIVQAETYGKLCAEQLDKFPDKFHPSRHEHQRLTQRILEMIAHG